jgi:Conjugative transposon protein TcpC
LSAARRLPGVTIVSRPAWRVRMRRGLPRHLLLMLSIAGIAASARYAIAPPVPASKTSTAQVPPPEMAGAAYAVLFARRYLTWTAGEPQASAGALEAFLGPSMEAGAGLQLPASGEQRVEWAEVVQQRLAAPGEQVYTVAAQTGAAGLLYLTVPVARTPSGALALAGYPAFVGPPAAQAAELPSHLREVTDPALVTVVQRALRNYLAASASELAADLTPEAHVSMPTISLALDAVERVDWAQQGSAVLATVQVQDDRGVHYTLAYELDVQLVQGRWEIAAVQTDPDA